MCGIAGSINSALDLGRLTKDLWHRGPDDQQTFREGNILLHHHRLAILDIAMGKQPMTHGHLTIIFNGEIYNHLDVRKKLDLQCQTNSDTETILRAFEKAGPKCLDEFDGMFAFVIYDRNKKCLFLCRDRAGEKPLYYYATKDLFVFASELNALKHQVKVETEQKNIEQYLLYGSIHGTGTPYKNVFELPPAHYAIVQIDDLSVNVQRWWNIYSFYQDPIDLKEDDVLRQLDQHLHTGIKRRIDSSDLEVGAFLSGGIDSGLVTSIASQYKPGLKTFTVSFDGTYDESSLARTVAEKYNTRHEEIRISFDSIGQDIETILSNYGEPFFDDSAIPSYYVSREARKYLTVILNGDGADELFGGYRRYVPFLRHDFFDPNIAVSVIARMVKTILPYSHEKQSKRNYIYRLSDLATKKRIDIYLSATTDIFSGFNQYLNVAPDNSLVELNKLFEKMQKSRLTGLQKIMYMDFNAILPDILLVKMDIATMANSLEGRSPFLSKEILEFAPRLKDELKIKGTSTKYLLRKLSQQYLPPILVSQPKRGFEVPLKNWVENELREVMMDYLTSPDSYAAQFIDKKFLSELIRRKVKVSDEKRAKMLYALFALDVWHAKCVKA